MDKLWFRSNMLDVLWITQQKPHSWHQELKEKNTFTADIIFLSYDADMHK